MKTGHTFFVFPISNPPCHEHQHSMHQISAQPETSTCCTPIATTSSQHSFLRPTSVLLSGRQHIMHQAAGHPQTPAAPPRPLPHRPALPVSALNLSSKTLLSCPASTHTLLLAHPLVQGTNVSCIKQSTILQHPPHLLHLLPPTHTVMVPPTSAPLPGHSHTVLVVPAVDHPPTPAAPPPPLPRRRCTQ